MPNSRRARGDYFERRTKATLEGCGFLVVRSAGSLGPADLVALRADCPPRLISCKTSHYLRPAERHTLVAAAARAGALPILASSPQKGCVLLEVVTPFGQVEPQLLRMPPRKRP